MTQTRHSNFAANNPVKAARLSRATTLPNAPMFMPKQQLEGARPLRNALLRLTRIGQPQNPALH